MQEIKPIDIVILVQLGSKISPLFTPISTEKMLQNRLIFDEVSIEEIQRSLKTYQPKNKHLVHKLYEMGFSPKTIADWLMISQSSVSYHLQKPLDSEYRNTDIQKYINHYHKMREIQKKYEM